jgi:hypothetical protein
MNFLPALVRRSLLPALLALPATLTVRAAEDATIPGELRHYSTIHSIGVEWDITGDANHNGTCQAHYRVKGDADWKEALPLFRVDYNGWYAEKKADRAYNMFAGSVLFLEPGTAYEVKLDLADPDGGSTQKTFLIATRAVPVPPKGGRTFHVAPGSAGGDGSKEKPFADLAAAQSAAKPGDTFLLHRGDYGKFEFAAGDEGERRIAWKAAGDGEAVFAMAKVTASRLWFEGLTFKSEEGGTGLEGFDVDDVVVSRCHFTGFHYSVVLRKGCHAWYIADNVMVGDNDPSESNISGEGVELGHSSDHDVCYNRISRVADGVSYCHRNCDIYGNDIFDVTDDGLEPDYGYANNRMWGNRITNPHNSGLSFQPMYCGPWYFIRNQIICQGYLFKFRVQDRFVLVNNTFVAWGFFDKRMHHILSALTRNNLFISAGTREGAKNPVWVTVPTKPGTKESQSALPDTYVPDWRTDVDYDGFDWAESKFAFRWNGAQYEDVATFSAAVGIERHGIRVKKEEIFERFNLPAEKGRAELQDLTLKAGCNAIDAGVRLPNIAEDFAGKAPDLGAHESGRPVAHYGPRPVK